MDTEDMPLDNPIRFIFEFSFRIVDLVRDLADFLFNSIEFAGLDVSVWQALGGFGLTTLIVYSIVRN